MLTRAKKARQTPGRFPTRHTWIIIVHTLIGDLNKELLQKTNEDMNILLDVTGVLMWHLMLTLHWYTSGIA